MARPNVCEGTIPPEDVLSPEALRTPGAELFSGTHWRVAGEIDSGLPPLLCLHGGPGSTCAYFELLDDIAADGRAVVTYDQIGCGGSYLDGVPSLWRAETWLAELEAVVSHLGLDDFHLLGQSWGGMLAITYLAERRPPQVRSVILSSTLSSSALWGREQRRMARQLPEAERTALAAAEKSATFAGAAYQRAIDCYMDFHCADVTLATSSRPAAPCATGTTPTACPASTCPPSSSAAPTTSARRSWPRPWPTPCRARAGSSSRAAATSASPTTARAIWNFCAHGSPTWKRAPSSR